MQLSLSPLHILPFFPLSLSTPCKEQFKNSMTSWYFSFWLFMVSVIKADNVTMNKRYISWDDLEVDTTGPPSGNNSGVIVVDPFGKGDSLTVQGAVDMVPENNQQRIKIHILPGVYSEKVYVPASKPYISFIGDPENPDATVIAWHDKASDDNMGTYKTASVEVDSDFFCVAGITIQNTYQFQRGAVGNQAVALRISGDYSVFYKSKFLGLQDTLLDAFGTHFFMDCFIQGSIDFIFGEARSLYKNCTLSVVGQPFVITAQRRQSATEVGGFSFVNCTVFGNGPPVLLGRAWGDYSRVVYAYTQLDLDVRPQGWDDWGVPSRQITAFYGEYMCSGRGANRTGRVDWSKALTTQEAQPYLDTKFIDGDQWLRL